MPCINANGEITESARQILTILLRPVPLTQVASETGLPLYRIRSAARELAQARLAVEANEMWQITETGRSALEKSLAPA